LSCDNPVEANAR